MAEKVVYGSDPTKRIILFLKWLLRNSDILKKTKKLTKYLKIKNRFVKGGQFFSLREKDRFWPILRPTQYEHKI